MSRYTDRVERLATKIKMSQVPVPGFIVGLSGTDSVVAFVMCYDAMARFDKNHRVLGVHYVGDKRKTPTWFERDVIPWLEKRCPAAEIITATPLGGNRDQQRWADLHLRALNEIEDRERPPQVHPYDVEDTYWVVGTINATEKALGRYSLLASAVSVQPLMTLYKSSIIEICRELGVPEIAIDKSRLPDCLCGRDELAADNIELIDNILRFNVDPTKHDPVLLEKLYTYIRDSQADYGFKERIPYVI